MSKERRLGRGLEALLGRVAAVDTEQPSLLDRSESIGDAEPDWMLQEALAHAKKTPQTLDVSLIDRNPYQPRSDFDDADLETLSASLKTHGLVQPIVVRSNGERFQIVAGERRYRAAILANWRSVPVHILDVDDRQMAELALTENIQRKDLNAMEKATAFAKYLEIYGGTHEELARRLELDRSTVTNLLRLLELPDVIQSAIRKDSLTQGHARALLPLEEWEQLEICERIQNESWSVRQTERFVKDLLASEGERRQSENTAAWNIIDKYGEKHPVDSKNVQIESLEQEIRSFLGAKVQLHASGGKGKIVIPFASHDEFERLFALLCRKNCA